MKKIIKALTIAVLAVAAVFACVFASGCTDNYTKLDYNFTIVYEDGKPVNGQTDGTPVEIEGNTSIKVLTQFCLPDGNCIPLNLANIYPDTKGRLSFTQEQINEFLQESAHTTEDVTEFVFHVMYVNGHKSDCEVEVHGAGDYTVTVTAQ